jgi:glycosyltransferase involved in cell wall biosynthesis
MKLLYLTNVQIPAENAQNLQIQAMSKAFFDSLKENFILISPWNKINGGMNPIYQWERVKIINWLPRSLRQLCFIVKTRKIVKKFKPDIIYTRDIAIAWFFRKLGFKTVYEIHKPFTTMIGNIIFKRICKKIKIIAISQALKDFIVNQYNLNSDMILVAHDGVDLKNFDILENKEQLREKYFGEIGNKFIVLYTGSQERGKGVEIIIDAASKLKDLVFVVIGSQKNKQEGNLIFKKRMGQKEIPGYLKAADLLVLPMNKELSYSAYSSPLKLFEYMASGTPILASKIGAISEILNEKNSFLFDLDKRGDFEERVLYAKNNELEARKRAEGALENVKNYTWEKRVDNIIKSLRFFIIKSSQKN